MNKIFIGRQQQGFSLIEVMIVVAIVGFLSAIAYPSYSSYVVKSKRTDAQRAMVEYAQSMERYFTANGFYTATKGTTGNNTCGGTAPSSVSLYAITCATASDSTFTITATPTTGTAQANDGNMTLTNTGVKTGTWKF
ncbi:prepilin-type N-terminal cleavage/methylation domain-containing protein [Dechloromonas sp. TW-R-39-2]|uniref:type IV pilin protein n=1 Tax=Dechloromonas sp. TW-R-39-2 TaxID=2654218 RepID=UPI00193D0FC8|nr:type IV pilin protein [Dechloromonas sp. TW-R-39-2]QRM18023.1 prepilin-type N-terminal cleavage/methylation domain-containing protein [Dechloromonas sp. TW-R-39-2]